MRRRIVSRTGWWYGCSRRLNSTVRISLDLGVDSRHRSCYSVRCTGAASAPDVRALAEQQAASPASLERTSTRRFGMKLRGLRQARQRSGLSLGQLAELTGLRRETIAHLEQGKEDPQPYALNRLTAILGASTLELAGPSAPAKPAAEEGLLPAR